MSGMMLPRWPEIYHDRRAPDSNTPQFMSSLSAQTRPKVAWVNVGSQRFRTFKIARLNGSLGSIPPVLEQEGCASKPTFAF
jgi:hypothetical protein